MQYDALRVTRRSALAGMATLIAATGTAGAQSAPVPLTIGAPPNDASGPIYFAEDLGYYKKAGLVTTLTMMNNPAPITTAVISGSITIAGMPIPLIAVARDKGLPIVMVAPLGVYVSAAPDRGLVVLKDSPLKKASDLNGKTVAVRDLGNMAFFGAKVWIDKNGGDSKAVKWIEAPDTVDLAALQSGRIDAASISEPALDAALKTGDVRIIAPVYDAIAPRFLIAACVCAESFAKANPQLIRTYADVIAATATWANANQAKTAPIVEKYSNAVIAPGATRSLFAERLRVADVQPLLDVLYTSGQIKTPAKAADLFAPGVM
jgi:NitT/TauT family transport system substrate-binding protein